MTPRPDDARARRRSQKQCRCHRHVQLLRMPGQYLQAHDQAKTERRPAGPTGRDQPDQPQRKREPGDHRKLIRMTRLAAQYPAETERDRRGGRRNPSQIQYPPREYKRPDRRQPHVNDHRHGHRSGCVKRHQQEIQRIENGRLRIREKRRSHEQVRVPERSFAAQQNPRRIRPDRKEVSLGVVARQDQAFEDHAVIRNRHRSGDCRKTQKRRDGSGERSRSQASHVLAVIDPILRPIESRFEYTSPARAQRTDQTSSASSRASAMSFMVRRLSMLSF